MNTAAIGVRMHSGWGALVAVSNSTGTIAVVERRRLEVIPTGASGVKQPYHFAKTLALPDAETFIGNCFAASKDLARMAIREVVNELSGRQYRVVASAVLLASGRALPPLEKILASHAAIHTAEGEFFRDVFSRACHELSLPVTGFRERDLDQCLHAVFGRVATKLTQQVSTLGKSLGPPWTTDQKNAAFAALLALTNKKQ